MNWSIERANPSADVGYLNEVLYQGWLVQQSDAEWAAQDHPAQVSDLSLFRSAWRSLAARRIRKVALERSANAIFIALPMILHQGRFTWDTSKKRRKVFTFSPLTYLGGVLDG